MQKKKVLYISYDGLTDPLGQSQILPYLTNLSTLGYKFTVLSFEKRDRLESEGQMVMDITEAANIVWVPLMFTANPPVLSKIYDRFLMRRVAVRLHVKEQFDLIHCRSYVAAEVGLYLKKNHSVKMIFDMRGFWADEKVDNGQWNLNKFFFKNLYNHYKRKEKEFLLAADGIVSLTNSAKEYLLRKDEFKNLKIDVIPCCADLDHFNYENIDDQDVQRLKEKLNISATAKVISYVGSIGGWYMINEMFRLYKVLEAQNPDFRMLILTKDDPAKIRAEASALGIANDKIHITYSTRANLPSYMAISTLSLFFIRNTFSKIASSPTKHAELMGMGIPVICNNIGDTGNIIAQSKTGFVVDAFDDDAFKQLANSISELERLDKAHIRMCAEQLFDLQKGVQKYFSLYQRIVAN